MAEDGFHVIESNRLQKTNSMGPQEEENKAMLEGLEGN